MLLYYHSTGIVYIYQVKDLVNMRADFLNAILQKHMYSTFLETYILIKIVGILYRTVSPQRKVLLLQELYYDVLRHR